MSILLKAIKNGTDVVALGELQAADVAEITNGGLKFADGTIQTTAATSGDVSSVHGRVGDVVSANGDYTGAQVTNVPAGSLTSVTVQAAIDELENKKMSAAVADTKYQPLDADLTAIAGLATNSGILRKTAADTWELDTKDYVTATDVVSSFNTRVGAVVSAAGDYNAAQVTLDPTNIDGIDATNVQTGFEQISTLIGGMTNGLVFMGQLAFDAADPTPPTAAPSHYYIFNTAGERPGVGPVQAGDWLAYNLQTSEWVHLDYSARTFVAAQISYDGTGNTYITGPEVDAALDQADAALVAIDTRIDALENAPAAGVTSFNGRGGAVMPTAGDYSAGQTTFTPTATILSTEVQAAIEEVGSRAIPFFDTTGASKPILLV